MDSRQMDLCRYRMDKAEQCLKSAKLLSSKILTESFSVRNDSDYDDYCTVSGEQAEGQIKNARFFVDGVKEYIEKQLPQDAE